MANAILTPTVIAREALMQVKNNLRMGSKVHRQYVNEFKKVGSSVTVRRPVKFVVTDGTTRSNQDVEEGNATITVNKRKHVSWSFNTQDMTLSIEEYSERYIKPGAIALANMVDVDLAGLYKNVCSWVGTPGQTINSFADLAKAPERLDDMAVPSERCAILSPSDFWGLAGAQSSLFAPMMVKDAFQYGNVGMIAGLELSMDQNIQSHTTGTFTTGSTPLVNGAAQNVTYDTAKATTPLQQTLETDGWAASTNVFKAGDVFTIAGVYAVNPVPGEGSTGKQVQSFLQQFTVLSDVTSNGAGAATVTISPAIITSGPYQTVDSAPADNAAITPLGTEGTSYRQNMAFHKNAFALVTLPIEMPDSVGWKSRMTDDGISIRLVKDYNIDNDEEVIRMDILYAVAALYPELATRVSGTA